MEFSPAKLRLEGSLIMQASYEMESTRLARYGTYLSKDSEVASNYRIHVPLKNILSVLRIADAIEGEISAAMEVAFDRYGTQPTPVKGIYGGAYKEDARWDRLLRGVEAVERLLGRKPRMFVAKMGQDGHDRGAKIIARALRDAGMEVIYTGIRQTPEMIAEAALQEDVDAVGLSILSGAHMELCPRVIQLLKDRGMGEVPVFIGGIIPDEDVEGLKQAGVREVFGPGTPTTAIVDYVRGLPVEPA